MRSFDINHKQDIFFTGIYRGVVEHNIDPLKAGRIRLRIMGIHSDNRDAYVETKHLPWATPSTIIGHGGSRNIGSCEVPSIGSHVYCFFESGDHNAPVYFACAPAIEDIEDYQSKDGVLKDAEKDSEFEFDEFYDDRTNYDDSEDEFETPRGDKPPTYPVPDWCEATRLNIHGETEPEPEGKPQKMIDPNNEDEDSYEPRNIFPEEFFKKDIRVAFEGDLNLEAKGYDGKNGSVPGDIPEDDRELKEWNERKWGYNDEDFEGDEEWEPEYPMVSTKRNMQGEIEDRDVLKLRKTYIHPSKYYEEIVQLDAEYKFEDFLNEKSVKYTYEAQRGYQNYKKEKDQNELSYYNKEGQVEERGHIKRFEKRIHNPGRERTINEDVVYKYFMDKVNITFENLEEDDEFADLNILFVKGNNNLEIEEGDINIRLHKGHENKYLDEGNRTYTIKDGNNRLYVDGGYDHLVIGGNREWGNVVQSEPPRFWQRFEIPRGTQEFRIGISQLFDIGSNQEFTIGGNQDFMVSGSANRMIMGSYERLVGGSSTVLANGAVTIKGSTVTVQASNITLNSPTVTCTGILEAKAVVAQTLTGSLSPARRVPPPGRTLV